MEEKSVLSIKHSSPVGDLLSILPGLRQLFRETGRRIRIYQGLNVVGYGIPGVNQPYQNSDGESIMMGKETFDMVRPLLLAQDYIEDFLEFKGEKVDYDMDEIRLKTFTNQPLGSLARWPFYGFPEMACDLSERWIETANDYRVLYADMLIINFTNRYRNNWINYFFLKQYEGKLFFAGLRKERDDFCKKWNLDIQYLNIDDFLDLANCMNSCKGFLGNQSMMFQIAEGLKIPRILEVCQMMPNVIPIGAEAYDYYHQQAVELYVHKLFNS